MARALRRRDFEGDHVVVKIGRDGLSLTGATRGFLHLPMDRVAQLRAGFTESKYGPVYEAKLWLDGERDPIPFIPCDRSEEAAYAAAVRKLAAALAEKGAPGRVERGHSMFEAFLGPALMAPLVLAGVAAATISADPPVWWHFVVIPFVPAVVLGVLVWRAVVRHMPRPVRALSELDVQLP